MQGQTFIALDPGNFAPNFPERMETFMQEMRHLKPVSYSLPARCKIATKFRSE